jgi:hypothetical protein
MQRMVMHSRACLGILMVAKVAKDFVMLSSP